MSLDVNSVDRSIFDAARNCLTEYSKAYKRINQFIVACYEGIESLSLSKVASLLFRGILKDKVYGEKETSKRDIDEDKRIYNYSELSIDDLLKEGYSIKYAKNNNTLVTDRSNMLKRIRELEENNVFYIWQFQDINIYIMEREIGSWKMYNELGCVTPKMLKKIVAVSKNMMDTMTKMITKKYSVVNTCNMEKSFGRFFNHMLGKTNPLIISNFNLWDGHQNIHDYLKSLNFSNVGDYQGLEFEDKFFLKLPFSVSKKMENEINKRGGTMRKKKVVNEQMQKNLQEQLVFDITPKHPIVTKRTRVKRNHVININGPFNKPLMPEAQTFDDAKDPFNNPREFVDYYRSCMNLFTHGHIEFNNYSIDCPDAACIMDVLIERNVKDKNFLTSWFRYYFDNNLKGDKAMKIKNTSLRAVKETLDLFEPKYIE